jgi:hypothetical protein
MSAPASTPRRSRRATWAILASTDILAVENASTDIVYNLPEAELHDLRERIESRNGLRQLSYLKAMKMSNDQDELIAL